MGYTTEFAGKIQLSRALTFAEAKQLLTWANDPDNIDQPKPESYLQWVPNRELDAIGWDGNEKFYNYTAWMQWVCDWLKGIGITANGTLKWSGEETQDVGLLTVVDNITTATEQRRNVDHFQPIDLRELANMALEQVA